MEKKKKEQRKVVKATKPKSNLEIIRKAFEDEIPSIESEIAREVSEEHSPPGMKGTARYGKLTTNIRRRLCDEYGWKSKNEGGTSLSISPDRESALIIRTGNAYTGRSEVSSNLPKTNNGKISICSRNICNGQESFSLIRNTELLLLLHRKSKDGNTMHAEISKVSELDGESIVSLTDRYCFSVNLNTGAIKRHDEGTPRQDDFIVEDFTVERK